MNNAHGHALAGFICDQLFNISDHACSWPGPSHVEFILFCLCRFCLFVEYEYDADNVHVRLITVSYQEPPQIWNGSAGWAECQSALTHQTACNSVCTLPRSILGALRVIHSCSTTPGAPESSWMLIMKSGALLEHSGDALLLHCSWELLSVPELILSQNSIFTPCACRELCCKTSKLCVIIIPLSPLSSIFLFIFL